MRVFNKTQRFTQWWLQILNIGIVFLLFYALYKWFIIKEPMGDVGIQDSAGQLIFIFSIIAVLILLYSMRMETTIDEIGIHYRFIPFHSSKKTIRWSDMERCYVRRYNPIREYGGWGLRGSFGKSKAYNVKGNIGIQTVLKNEEKILIGTQMGEAATAIIQRYSKKES